MGKKYREVPPYRGKKGAPTKLEDRTIVQTIVDAVRAGLSYERAAQFAGVATSTLSDWRKRGNERPDSIYGHFVEELKIAEAESEYRSVLRIHAAAEGDPEKGIRAQWQADAWFLERRHPDRWGRHRLEITGPGGRPLFERVIMATVLDEDGNQSELAGMGKLLPAGPGSDPINGASVDPIEADWTELSDDDLVEDEDEKDWINQPPNGGNGK